MATWDDHHVWHDRDWWYKHNVTWVDKHHPHWHPWPDYDDAPHDHGHANGHGHGHGHKHGHGGDHDDDD